jgi:hypothetical protein
MIQIIKTEANIVSYPELGFRGSAGSPALAGQRPRIGKGQRNPQFNFQPPPDLVLKFNLPLSIYFVIFPRIEI